MLGSERNVHMSVDAYQGQRRKQSPLELGKQTVVNLMRVLGMELRLPGREVCINC